MNDIFLSAAELCTAINLCRILLFLVSILYNYFHYDLFIITSAFFFEEKTFLIRNPYGFQGVDESH